MWKHIFILVPAIIVMMLIVSIPNETVKRMVLVLLAYQPLFMLFEFIYNNFISKKVEEDDNN